VEDRDCCTNHLVESLLKIDALVATKRDDEPRINFSGALRTNHTDIFAVSDAPLDVDRSPCGGSSFGAVALTTKFVHYSAALQIVCGRCQSIDARRDLPHLDSAFKMPASNQSSAADPFITAALDWKRPVDLCGGFTSSPRPVHCFTGEPDDLFRPL
jgi:hypothetical protein